MNGILLKMLSSAGKNLASGFRNAAASALILTLAAGVSAQSGAVPPGAEQKPVAASAEPERYITIFDAVRMALENNREMEVERINVEQTRYDLFAARGTRDITLSGGSYYEHMNVPTGSVLGGGPDGTLLTKTFSYDMSASQLLSTGGRWTAQVTYLRDDSNNQYASLNPQYQSALTLELRQPLVRNLSIDDSRRRIRIENRRLNLTDSQFRQVAIDVVSRVERAYWDLVFARRDLDIRRQAVDLAKSQFERNSRMVDQGTVAQIDLVSIQVEIERRNENVLLALETVARAENALKQLILSDRDSAQWEQHLVPVDTPEVKGVLPAVPEIMAAALTNRPEIAQNDIKKEINDADVTFYQNQARPQIDLIARYTSNGMAGSSTGASSPFTSAFAPLVERVNQLSGIGGLPPVGFDMGGGTSPSVNGGYGTSLWSVLKNDYRTFRVGVSFSFPLRNRTAEAQLGRSIAEGRKIENQRRLLQQAITVEARNAHTSVMVARQRVEVSRASREAAEKQLESEQRRFGAGLSTTFLILERQNALSESKGRELKALTDYNKAVSDLNRVMGSTLTASNVEMSIRK